MDDLRGSLALRNRCVFRMTGGDRLRYLNGQVTNDVRNAAPGRALYACVTNAKGKLEGDVYLAPHPDGSSYWLDAPVELREALHARLEKYIIADDVEVEDVTDEVGIWHVLGWEDLATTGWSRRANRFGVEGWDVLGAKSEAVLPAGIDAADPAAVEELRIASGIGLWGRELGPDVLPQEANLQERAIDFSKGCYIGQEVISRIKSAGKVNRVLRVMVTVEGDTHAPEPGDSLWAGNVEAGVVTSVSTKCRLRRIIALGYVKKAYAEPGTALICRGGENGRTCRVELRLAPVKDLNQKRGET